MSSLAAGVRLGHPYDDTAGRSALVLEDEPAVQELIERCLAGIGFEVCAAANVSEAQERLASQRVDLLVTDLGLPGASGIDFLRGLAPDERPAIIVLTGRDDEHAVESALDLGAFAYIAKPFHSRGLQVATAAALRQKDLERVHLSTIATLRGDIARRAAEEGEAAQSLAYALGAFATAVESRDLIPGGHVQRMGAYCAKIAAEIGLSTEEQHALSLAAGLHDVGTIALPERILLKGGLLTEHELWLMQSHCQAGYEILTGSSSPVLQLAAEIALTHHEWFDGCGYPRGLRGTDIPLAGRIAAVADVFDALTSFRPYRSALQPRDAVEIMKRERGSHFDPNILDHFLHSGILQAFGEPADA